MQNFPESKAMRKRYTKLFKRKVEAISRAQAEYEDRKWKEHSKKPQQFLWKAVTEAIGNSQSDIPPMNNGTIITKKAKEEKLLNTFKKGSERTKTESMFEDRQLEIVEDYLRENKDDFRVDTPQYDYNSELTLSELEFALSKLKKSAVGPDGIPNWVYKNCTPSLKKHCSHFSIYHLL